MEAAGRLPMLFCELKVSPSSTEFGIPLKKYIREHYQEDPESYKKEIKDLEILRQLACKVPLDFTGCSILKRYYSQLNLLQNRFPMTADGSANVPFTWSDIYSGSVFCVTDIEYEQACILYNIGALHSYLGALDPRSNADGMKIACTHFQCAVWALQHLQENYPQPKGSDMAHDLLSFWINVMLAQAQECILEKSMLDNRKSSITAKIAAQVVDYYRCTLGIMLSNTQNVDIGSIIDIVGSKMFKIWKKYIEFKMSYYTSISHFYMGNQCEEQQKMGERVAWYQSASEYLNVCFKISKGMNRDELNEALTFLMDIVGGKHNSSKKENDFVYHEKVPPSNSLLEIKGASLVKGIPFDITDPEVCGSDIFSHLVPMETHASASLYSEEKAKLLRATVAKIEGKNEELTAYLSSLQLDESIFSEKSEIVPQELFEKCASMSVHPTAVTDLTELTKSLTNISKEVDDELKSCRNLLLKEEYKESKHQEIFGKRIPSMIIGELSKECSKYEDAHKRAVESNKTLSNAVSVNIDNLHLLTGPLEKIVEALPSVASLKSSGNTKVLQEFQLLLKKVDEMREQRQRLEQQLRDDLLKDDITKHLLVFDKSNDIKKMFAEGLKKHDKCLSFLDQNLKAQDNILHALTQANASSADFRTAFTVLKQEREVVICSLINSYEAYKDLILKAKKGLEFYEKLESNVSRLLNRIKSVSNVQDEERTQIAEVQMRKNFGGKDHGLSQDASAVPMLRDYLPLLPNEKTPYVTFGANNQSASKSNVSLDLNEKSPTINPISDFSCQQHEVMSSTSFQANIKSTSKSFPVSTNISHVKEKFELPSIRIESTPLAAEQSTPAVPYSIPFSVVDDQPKFTLGGPQWHYSSPNHFNTNFTTMYSAPQLSVTPFSSSMSCAEHEVFPPLASNNPPIQTNLSNSFNSAVSDVVSSIYPNTTLEECKSNFQLPIYHMGLPSSNLTGVSGSDMPLVLNTSIHDPMLQSSTNSVNHQIPYLISSLNTLSQSEIHISKTNVSNCNTLGNIETVYPYSYSTNNPVYPEYCSTPLPSGLESIGLTTYQSAPGVLSGVCSTHTISSADNLNCSQINQFASASSTPLPYSELNYYSCNYQPISIDNLWDHNNQNSAFQYHPYVSAPEERPTILYEPLIKESGGTFSIKSDCQVLPSVVKNSEPERSVESKEVMQKDEVLNSVKFAQPSSGIECGNFSDSSVKDSQCPASVLQPEVLKVMEAAGAEGHLAQFVKDPLDDLSVRTKFLTDVEKYEKIVEGLIRKSLNGTTPLDQKWKELTDTQEKESRKMSISVARCYPLKNRFPDIMPYDNNRVKLTSAKDDYINASYLKDILPGSPVFLITQAPLPTTYNDFWIMVWEQQVETLICLLPDNELKNHVYWPKERGQVILFGSLEVSLQSRKDKSGFIEHIIGLTHNKNKISRVVIHLQFTMWYSSGVPNSPSQLLQFIAEALSYQKQQRSLLRPVVVHCSAGVGRSGVFCLAAALINEMSNGHGPRDVTHVAARISQQRKFLIQDKDQLKFCYDVVLYYAQDQLMRRGILTNRASFDDKLPISSSFISHSRHPSEDFILGSGGLAKLQSSLAKMGLSKQSNTPDDTVSSLVTPKLIPPCDALKFEKNITASLSDNDSKCDKICTTNAEIHNIDEQDNLETDCNVATKPPTIGCGESPDITCSSSSISSILDPSNFYLDCSVSPSKRRITKDSFLNSNNSLKRSSLDNTDPLSQLDPLWSMKKNNS